MKHDELENEILNLIEQQTEGVYWDFKQQWYSNNADLLHDVICMANSPANRDCYIIIGVEDGTYNILGVSSENRKDRDLQGWHGLLPHVSAVRLTGCASEPACR